MSTLSERFAAFMRERKAAASSSGAAGSTEQQSQAAAGDEPLSRESTSTAANHADPAVGGPGPLSSAVRHGAATPRGGSSSWRDRVASFFERTSSPAPTAVTSDQSTDDPSMLPVPVTPGDLLVRLVQHHCASRHPLFQAAASLRAPAAARAVDLRRRVLGFLAAYGPCGPATASSDALDSSCSVDAASPTRRSHPPAVLAAVDQLAAADAPTEFVLEQLRIAYRAYIGVAGSAALRDPSDASTTWTALERTRWLSLMRPLLPNGGAATSSAGTVNTRGHTGGGELDRRPEVDADAQWFVFHGVGAVVDHTNQTVFFVESAEVLPDGGAASMEAASPTKSTTALAVSGADEHAFVAQLLRTTLSSEAPRPALGGGRLAGLRPAPDLGADGYGGDDDDSDISTSVGMRSVCSAVDVLHADGGVE